MPGSITIALDVMSGDNGPAPAIAGAIKSLQNINDLRIMLVGDCLLYTSPSPRDRQKSRMPSSA